MEANQNLAQQFSSLKRGQEWSIVEGGSGLQHIERFTICNRELYFCVRVHLLHV